MKNKNNIKSSGNEKNPLLVLNPANLGNANEVKYINNLFVLKNKNNHNIILVNVKKFHSNNQINRANKNSVLGVNLK